MNSSEQNADRKENPGYETSDVNARRIFLFILSGIIVLVLILIALDNYFKYVADEEEFEMVLKPQSKPLTDLKQREQQILGTYGIADSSSGAYRIPIDSAMQIMLREAGATGSLKK